MEANFDKKAPELKNVDLLSKNTWLSNLHITFWFQELKENFPSIQGLVNPERFVYKTFNANYNSLFVNILHVNSNHWLCVSNYKCNIHEINIYDSLQVFRNGLPTKVLNLFNKMQPNLRTVRIKAVQQQTNGVDCGLFSLAYATSICNNIDPCTIFFNQLKLREHFNHCVSNKHVLMFPYTVNIYYSSKTKT